MMKLIFVKQVALALGLLLLGACHQASSPSPSEPRALSSNDKEASCLSLTQTPKQNLWISWVEKDSVPFQSQFCLCFKQKGSPHFEQTIKIKLPGNPSYMFQNEPKLVAKTEDSLWIVYVDQKKSDHRTHEYTSIIKYLVSGDAGKTWSQPFPFLGITDEHRSLSFLSVIRLPNGHLAFSWMGDSESEKTARANPVPAQPKAFGETMSMGSDSSIPVESRHEGRPLLYAEARGVDQFSTPLLLEKAACPCCRSALAVAPNGRVAIAYRAIRDGSIRDVAYTNKSAGAAYFTVPVVFSGDDWKLEGCPHDGPSMVINNRTNYISYFTGAYNKGVFYSELDTLGHVLNKRKVETSSRYSQVARDEKGNSWLVYNHDYKEESGDRSMVMFWQANQQGAALKVNKEEEGAIASWPVLVSNGQTEKTFSLAWITDGVVWFQNL